jgi:hypothetical protein
MRRLLIALAVAVAALASAAPAGAKIIQVGPNLSGATAEEHFSCTGGGTCEFAQKSPSTYTAPVTGEIVEWQLKGATGEFLLWLFDGNTATSQSAIGKAEGGKTSFPAAIPVEQGQRFAVEMFRDKDKLGASLVSGASVSGWTPNLQPGETRAPDKSYPGVELLANVRILPAPGITAVTPSSGTSDAQVTITGHDFIDVKGVSFGGTPTNYEVRSETEIVAEAFAFSPGVASVSVSTVAGTATATDAFTFEEASPESGSTPPIVPPVEPPPPVVIPPIPPLEIPPLTFPPETPECHVPKLRGKTLKQAKPLLLAAHCKLGKVTKRKGVKATRGKVVAETPSPGAPAPNGWPVRITLG